MKRILLLLLLAIPILGGAQPFLTSLAYERALSNSEIGGSVGLIHKATDNALRDSLYGLIGQLYGLISTAGNLQAVTAAGNSTTLGMYSGSGTFASPGTGTYINGAGSVDMFLSGINAGGIVPNGGAAFQSKDMASGNVSLITAGPLTTIRKIYMPDEGTPSNISASTIVTHTTKDPITIGSSATNLAIAASTLQMERASVPYIYVGQDTGANSVPPSGIVAMYSAVHGTYDTLRSDTTAGSNHSMFLPNGNGTLLLSNQDNLQQTLSNGDTTNKAIRIVNNLSDYQGKDTGFVGYFGWNYSAGDHSGNLRLRDTLVSGLYHSGVNIQARHNFAEFHGVWGPSNLNNSFGYDLVAQSGDAHLQIQTPSGTFTNVDTFDIAFKNPAGFSTTFNPPAVTSNVIDTIAGYKNIPTYTHTVYTPVTTNTVNVVATQVSIINPAGTIAALTINLPSSPTNHTIVIIDYTQIVTTITYSGGSVVGAPTSASVGLSHKLVYDSGTSTWYP